jgi:hypothetical protein
MVAVWRCEVNLEHFWNAVKCLVLISFIASFPALASGGQERGEVSAGRLQAPTILSPADRSEIRGIFKVTFAWSQVPEAAAYHFILARDRRFKDVVYQDPRALKVSCTVSDLSYGTYFFRVSSIAKDGSEGPFSDVFSFVVVPPPPKIVKEGQ